LPAVFTLLIFCPMNIFGLMRFAIFSFATIALTSAAVGPAPSGDVFTPVIASALSPETHAVRGTDNVYHIVYELQLTNTRPLPATIRSIDVLEASNASKLITSFSVRPSRAAR
jgi:hypothetical protein